MADIRFGVLGAASITPSALFKPVRAVEGVRVSAIAARDPARAARAAAKWDVATVHPDYATLIADPDIDAVYIPLPNGLHAQWTVAAIRAGKHVLCEKPFTSNAVQAQEVADVAAASDVVVMEAFHYRYHPLMARALGLLADGAIGPVRHVEAELSFPLPKFSDIRYRLDLAGGALMDAGCYAVHCVRTLAAAAGAPDAAAPDIATATAMPAAAGPTVVAARAKLRSPGVDRAMTASLRFPGGVTATVTCSMWSRRLLGVSARAVGERGELRITNFVAPQVFNRLTLRTPTTRWSERVAGEPSYHYQLRAFVAAVNDGADVLTPPSDAVANMGVIDAIYEAAGLAPRS